MEVDATKPAEGVCYKCGGRKSEEDERKEQALIGIKCKKLRQQDGNQESG